MSKTGRGSHVYAPSWRHISRLPYCCRCPRYAPGVSNSNYSLADYCVVTINRSIDLACHCLAITVLEAYVCYDGIAEERGTSKTHGEQDDTCVEMYVYRVSLADEELMACAALATLAAVLTASGYRACDLRAARLCQPGATACLRGAGAAGLAPRLPTIGCKRAFYIWGQCWCQVSPSRKQHFRPHGSGTGVCSTPF